MLIKKRNTSIEYHPCTSSWGIPAGLKKLGQETIFSVCSPCSSDPSPEPFGLELMAERLVEGSKGSGCEIRYTCSFFDSMEGFQAFLYT